MNDVSQWYDFYGKNRVAISKGIINNEKIKTYLEYCFMSGAVPDITVANELIKKIDIGTSELKGELSRGINPDPRIAKENFTQKNLKLYFIEDYRCFKDLVLIDELRKKPIDPYNLFHIELMNKAYNDLSKGKYMSAYVMFKVLNKEVNHHLINADVNESRKFIKEYDIIKHLQENDFDFKLDNYVSAIQELTGDDTLDIGKIKRDYIDRRLLRENKKLRKIYNEYAKAYNDISKIYLMRQKHLDNILFNLNNKENKLYHQEMVEAIEEMIAPAVIIKEDGIELIKKPEKIINKGKKILKELKAIHNYVRPEKSDIIKPPYIEELRCPKELTNALDEVIEHCKPQSIDEVIILLNKIDTYNKIKNPDYKGLNEEETSIIKAYNKIKLLINEDKSLNELEEILKKTDDYLEREEHESYVKKIRDQIACEFFVNSMNPFINTTRRENSIEKLLGITKKEARRNYERMMRNSVISFNELMNFSVKASRIKELINDYVKQQVIPKYFNKVLENNKDVSEKKWKEYVENDYYLNYHLKNNNPEHPFEVLPYMIRLIDNDVLIKLSEINDKPILTDTIKKIKELKKINDEIKINEFSILL